MPEERAAELAMEKTNALWTAYHKEKDPKERERIKLEIDKAHPSRLGAAHLVRGTQHGVVGGTNQEEVK